MLIDIMSCAVSDIEMIEKYYKATSPQVKETVANIYKDNIRAITLIVLEVLSFASENDTNWGSIYNELQAEDHGQFLEALKKDADVKIDYDNKTIELQPHNINDRSKYDINIAINNVMNANRLLRLNQENVIVSVITKFEYFISQVFKYLADLFPEKYLANKPIEYSEIIRIQTDDIKSYFIERAVNSIMDSDLENWIALLKSHKLEMDFSCKEFHVLKEAYYRRNIIIHNSCKVDKRYLQSVSDLESADHRIGEELTADSAYITRLIKSSIVIIYSLIISLTKIEKSFDCAKKVFISLFSHLSKGDWPLCEIEFEKLMNLSILDDEYRFMSRINYWIAVKNQRGLNEIRNDIEKLDCSALNSRFIIAKKMLLDQFDEATVDLEKCFPDTINSENLENWPLFTQYRLSNQYREFIEKHRDEYGKITIADSNAQNGEPIDAYEEIFGVIKENIPC